MDQEGNHKPETKPVPPTNESLESDGPEKGVSAGSILRPLRTFKDDVAAALGKKKAGVVSVAAEEEKRRTRRRTFSERERQLQEEIEQEGAKIRTLTSQIEMVERKPGHAPPPKPSPKTGGQYTPPQGVPLHMARVKPTSTDGGTTQQVNHSKQLAELHAAEKRLAEAEAKLQETEQEGAAGRPVRLRPEPLKQNTTRRTLIIFSASIALLGTAVGIMVYVYQNFWVIGTVSPEQSAPTVISTDRSVEILYATETSLMKTLTDAVENIGNVARDNLTQLYVTRDTISGKRAVRAKEFVEELAPSAPGRLVRTLEDTYTFGIHNQGTQEAFLVVRTTFFENAFAGMLEWEVSMDTDLSLLFGPATSRVQAATDTRTAGRRGFQDQVIQNKDARVLRDQNDNITLLYSFVDRETLVITTNIETFVEVHGRLTSGRIVR